MYKIIKIREGVYSLYCTIIDDFIFYNLSLKEIKDILLESMKEHFEEDFKNRIEDLDRLGYEVYNQSKFDLPKSLEIIKQVHGNERLKKVVEIHQKHTLFKNYKLCYLRGDSAYFTDNMEKVIGDDWNDYPYEHNAEDPYSSREEFKVTKIYFKFFSDGKVEALEPCEESNNSSYSVDYINRKKIPWLTVYLKDEYFNNTDIIPILPGTTVKEFIKIIVTNGGVYRWEKKNV